MPRVFVALAAALAATVVTAPARAQQPATPAPARKPRILTPPPVTPPRLPIERQEIVAPPGTPASGVYDTLAFAAYRWREIGPFRGGRSVAVAGSAARPNEYWFGTTGGGVFKTTDGGFTWVPVTDKYFGGAIGAVGVSESNPDVVYVGTGEYPIRGNVTHGDGVWKTVDGGKTWTNVGLRDTRQISRVRVDPRNPDVAYVGAQGHVWAPNAERGVFRTRDGGKSWQRILFRNDSTGVTDLVMDATNSNVLYAAFWQAGRTPWQLVSGGAGSGIFKTTDGGDHWTELTRNRGLPAGILGNIGLAVSPAKPGRVWALVEADSGGVFRSDDGGLTWVKTNADRKLRQRAWYYTRIFADPKDTNTVYALNTNFYRSTDGGKTFRNIPVPHGDNHDLWIAANDPKRMIEANDGGANVSVNSGKTWTDQDQATAQFYHVTTTTDFPYHVCGAQQDNSTLCGPSRDAGPIGIDRWEDAGGGESGYIAVRPDDPNVVYAGSYGGLTTRKNMRTGEERDVNPWPDNPMGHDARDAKYRFQWTFPIVLSPHDPKTMYVGSNVLFRSTNEGQSYTPISPDLTRHDPATLGASGGPITKDQTSVEYYATIFAVAESPVKAGVIWTGSDDGLLNVTQDAGKTWTGVTPKDFGDWTRVSIVEPSHFAAGTAYVAANRYQLDDLRPSLWKTSDYGKSWTRIDAGIPPDEFTRVVREDPVRRGLLYAGTERGVWISFDDGAHWQSLRRNLPIVPVHDLAVAEGDLVAATHGRSFWILDDLSAIRQLSPEVAAAPAHLYKPRDAWRVQWRGGGSTTASHPVGLNPPSGATVYYTLAARPKEVSLAFLDAKGSVIRSFTSRQDSLTARDSIRKDSLGTVRRDSIAKATGITADSAKKLEGRAEGAGESAGGPADEDDEDTPRRAPRPPRVPDKPGLNRFTWNLRYPDASSFDGMILWAGGTQGPVAPPGTYAVRMTVDGGAPTTQTFVVRKDPRSDATQADLAEQFAFLVKIRDKVTEANDAVKTIRNVKAQLAERQKAVPPARAAALQALASVLDGRISAIERELYQVKNQSGQDPLNYPIRLNNKISALAGVVGGAEARPTAQSYAVFTSLAVEVDRQLVYLREAMRDVLPRVNAALRAAGQKEIVPSTAELPAKPQIADEDDDAEESEEAPVRW